MSSQDLFRNLVEQVEENKISRAEAINSLTTNHIEALQYNQLDIQLDDLQNRTITKGINASPGAASGQLFFNLKRARKFHQKQKTPVIWICTDLKPDTIEDITFFSGLIVYRGGATSHFAVVARQKGIPCIVGTKDIKIHESEHKIIIGEYEFSEGDWISIDGSTGAVIDGKSKILPANVDSKIYLHKLLRWADEIRSLKIYANADTPEDVEQAIKWGAEGLGVCRTEHTFLNKKVLPLIQQLLIADEISDYLTVPSEEVVNILIDRILPIQRKTFDQIFKIMLGKPVIIRLLDMSLDEFISDDKTFIKNIQECNFIKSNLSEDQICKIFSSIHETTPMLGFRGSRLGILMPAIYEMQIRAIFEATCSVILEKNLTSDSVMPKIMIPFVSYSGELEKICKLVTKIANEVMEEQNCDVFYQFGVMIETPRAAITADKIAEYAQFFSFGTNDLTQTTSALSRDDSEHKFLLEYIREGIIDDNPFQVLDRDGVGFLIQMASEKGRKKHLKMGSHLEIGVCGEHGGNPKSIMFCHEIGLDYVSCSPPSILIARLAAAHASLASN